VKARSGGEAMDKWLMPRDLPTDAGRRLRRHCPRPVRVNSIHPGLIDTPILEPTSGTEVEQTMIGLTPMGRLGRPDEVAAGMAHLASDEASFVAGPEIYIDDGYIAR